MPGPESFASAPTGGFPVEHVWNDKLAEKFEFGEEENVRLIEAVQKSSYKGQLAMGVALAEWLLWRFEGAADLATARQAVDACWAAVIHPAYAKPLGFEPDNIPRLSQIREVDGPLRIGLSVLRETRGRYAKGKPQLAASVMKLALLDQHVIPAKKEFEAWLTSMLERTAKALPGGPPPESEDEDADPAYNPGAGTPITREFFFDPEFKLTRDSNRAALSAFLASLDPKSNPFLRTPEELRQEGFTGEPYQLP